MRGFIRNLLTKIRGGVSLDSLKARGMKVGRNFHCMNGVWIDPGHCWLIEFGDNVTLAPRVTVLAHDASPQTFLKVTKVGRVSVGDNVFVGAGSIILPGVKIGSNVVIGSGSVICSDIPDNSLAVGNPCRVHCGIEEYIQKVDSIEAKFDRRFLFPEINESDKAKMNQILRHERFGLLVRR